MAVVLTVAIVLLVTPRSAWVALDVRRSSLRTTPDGVAAWSRALPALGIPTAARFTSFTAEEPRGAAIVLLEPVVAPTAAEIGALSKDPAFHQKLEKYGIRPTFMGPDAAPAFYKAEQDKAVALLKAAKFEAE